MKPNKRLLKFLDECNLDFIELKISVNKSLPNEDIVYQLRASSDEAFKIANRLRMLAAALHTNDLEWFNQLCEETL